jgi:hypothetical protein
MPIHRREAPKLNGRKRPYTEIELRRLRCVRCGEKATHQWQICSDGNIHRPICANCDIELNEMVLRWVGFPDWREKMENYRNATKEA